MSRRLRARSVSPVDRIRPAARFFIYAALIGWSLVCLFPIYWLAVTSLKGELAIAEGPFYLPFVDFAPTLESWRFILFDAGENLQLQVMNSAFVGLVSTVLVITIAGALVYGVSRFEFAVPVALLLVGLGVVSAVAGTVAGLVWLGGLLALATAGLFVAGARLRWRGPALSKSALVFLLLATRALPPVVIVLPIFVMAALTRTLDTRFALIVTYTATNLPVAIWLLSPVFGYRATEQEEAARIDGASHVLIFFRIVVPTVGAGLAAAAILVFFLCWNEYLFAAYLTSRNAVTLPPWVVGQLSMREAQVGGDIVEWSRLSAAIILTLAPMLLIIAFVQRALGRIGWRRG